MNRGLADHHVKKEYQKLASVQNLSEIENSQNTEFFAQMVYDLELENKENSQTIHKLYTMVKNTSSKGDYLKSEFDKKKESIKKLSLELSKIKSEVNNLINLETLNSELVLSDFQISQDPVLTPQFFLGSTFANKDQKYLKHPNWPAYKYKDRITPEMVLSTPNPIVVDNLKQFLATETIKGLSSSLVKEEIYPGYTTQVKNALFYGPFYFSGEYVICQFDSTGKQMFGWEIGIEEQRIVIGERKGRSWIGYHLEIGVHSVQEIDNSEKDGFKNLRQWTRQNNGKIKIVKVTE